MHHSTHDEERGGDRPIWTFDPTALRELLARRSRRALESPDLRHSAVLVPLFYRDDALHVLLTRRSDQVGSHKGQISFPGGRREPQDESLLATALREAAEEVGLDPHDVEVLGGLDDTTTLRTDRITPYVGMIPCPYPFRYDPAEVAYLIELPVAAFLVPERLRIEHFTQADGTTRPVYFFTFETPTGTEIVWGATARILVEWFTLMGAWRSVDIPGSQA